MRPRHAAWLALGVGLMACDAPPAPPPRAASAVVSAAPPAPSIAASGVASAAAPAPAPSAPPPPAPPSPPIQLKGGGKWVATGSLGVVTSVEKHATHVGVEVLQSGGNAVDAAVAVAFALAVTHPSAGNLGGGGFMLVRTPDGHVHALDFREAAPARVTVDGVLAMSHDGGMGYAAAGVPGTVAGLSLARDSFGTRPLAELVAPAIALARKGHALGARQALALRWAWPKLRKDPAARAIFGRGRHPLGEGERLVQRDLARTLEAIATQGKAGFYEGRVAEAFEAAMTAGGGLVARADLQAYAAKERAPLTFSYRGFDVATMPPPSMGGIALAEILLLLERASAYQAPLDSGASLHLFVEASRRAYADRRSAGADPDFMGAGEADRQVGLLTSSAYLSGYAPPIDPERATPSADVHPPPDAPAPESQETTHFSVVDAQGMAVACTVTLSAGYGAKVVVPGTGVVLGNALAAFSPSGKNEPAPGKRPASSMSPTIVSQGGKLALVLGSPGGDTIPNTVAQVLRNAVDYGLPIDDAVRRPRIHHQYLPDRIRVEKGHAPPQAALDDLVRRGHVLALDVTPIGDANDVLIDASGVPWAAADYREGGVAEAVPPPKKAREAKSTRPPQCGDPGIFCGRD